MYIFRRIIIIQRIQTKNNGVYMVTPLRSVQVRKPLTGAHTDIGDRPFIKSAAVTSRKTLAINAPRSRLRQTFRRAVLLFRKRTIYFTWFFVPWFCREEIKFRRGKVFSNFLVISLGIVIARITRSKRNTATIVFIKCTRPYRTKTVLQQNAQQRRNDFFKSPSEADETI